MQIKLQAISVLRRGDSISHPSAASAHGLGSADCRIARCSMLYFCIQFCTNEDDCAHSQNIKTTTAASEP
jgi:hypothetical protein